MDGRTKSPISVALISTSSSFLNSFKGSVEETKLALVKVAVTAHCAAEEDEPAQKLLNARPDIVFVDVDDHQAAIRSISLLHSFLPDRWVCACGSSADPQLIMECMSAGARDFLSMPVVGESLSLAICRYTDDRERLRLATKDRAKIYSVIPAKEGAGATSVAINLSIISADEPGRRVALVDLNSPGDLATYLDLKPQFCAGDALTAAKLDESLLETFMSRFSTVSLLAGAKPFEPSSPSMARLLRTISCTYTHAFLDVPSNLPPQVMQTIIGFSDAVLVVITPELSVLLRAQRLVDSLLRLNGSHQVRLILNRGDSWNGIEAREIEKVLERPVYWILPNDYRAALHSINSAIPMVAQRHLSISNSYRELTASLTGILVEKERWGFWKFLPARTKKPAPSQRELA